MDVLSNILSAIPDTIWGVFIGSGISLVTLFLQNRESRKHLFAQLKHDSEQRDRDRKMSWRRDVYMDAAQSISRGQSFLGRLVDLNTSDQELSTSYQDDLSRIAKVQVVATEKTIEAVTAYTSEFTSVYLQLTLDRIPLIQRRNAISLLDHYVEKASREIARYVELMKQLNLQGSTDQRTWNVLNEYIAFERKQEEQYTRKRQELATLQDQERLALIKSCCSQGLRLATLMPPALFAVRAELDLPLDREQYMKCVNEGLERNKAALDSFFLTFQRQVGARHDDTQGAGKEIEQSGG